MNIMQCIIQFNRRLAAAVLFLLVMCVSLKAQKKNQPAKGFINVATYNLRYANHGDSVNGNGWGQRLPVIAALIRFHNFDIFGTQEGLYAQLEGLKDSLPGYSYIGIGREDGKQAGEHSAIFYKTDMFRLLDKGNFWLSTVTDRPNKGWDAVLPRICSWGKFEDVHTGFSFYFFNLHMDHVGVQARAESAKLVLSKIKAFPPQTPVILTGDFNVDQHNESYALVNSSGILKDSYELSELRYASNGTFNSFRTDNKTESRIDHIFVGRQFSVLRYGILTDTYRSATADTSTQQTPNAPAEISLKKYTARTPSDHFPVMVQLRY